MPGTPTAESLRSFYFKCDAPWLLSEALQCVGVDVRWIGICMLLCALIFEELRGWIKKQTFTSNEQKQDQLLVLLSGPLSHFHN